MVDTKRYATIREASEQVGIPIWKLHRAARMGQLQTYAFFNSRKLVCLTELIALIESKKVGSAK
jgi:hypothetical protein